MLFGDSRIDCVLTFRTSPSSLANIEATAYRPAVCLAGLRIYEPLLSLDDCAGLTLVVNTEHFASDLKLAAFAGYRNRFQKFQLTLTIQDVLGVELGHAINRLGVGAGIEVNNLLVGVLKGQDDRICGESSELRVQFLGSLSVPKLLTERLSIVHQA